MSSELLERRPRATENTEKARETKRSDDTRGWVLVKADTQSQYELLTPHALAIAEGLGKRLRLIEVLNNHEPENIPVDPIAWDMNKRQAEVRLSGIVAQFSDTPCYMDYKVLDNCLLSLAGVSKNSAQEPMLCVVRSCAALPWDEDDITRHLMRSGCHCALLVPESYLVDYPIHYQRIAVTLDGSTRAESVMPMAIALAQFHSAQLIVLHAIPEPGLTQTGPLEAEAVELSERITTRNRRIAQQYLTGIRARYETCVESFETRLIEGRDVKHQLMETIDVESIDLLVLASHGATGHTDVSQGAVAQFLLEHVATPVLMLGRAKTESSKGPLANADLNPRYRSAMTPE